MDRNTSPLLGDVIEVERYNQPNLVGTVTDVAHYSDAVEGNVVDEAGERHHVHFAHVSEGWNFGAVTRSNGWRVVTEVAIPTDFVRDDDCSPYSMNATFQVRAWTAGIDPDALTRACVAW